MFLPILLEGQIQSVVWDGLFSTEQEILSCRVQRVYFSAKAFSQVELREIWINLWDAQVTFTTVKQTEQRKNRIEVDM